MGFAKGSTHPGSDFASSTGKSRKTCPALSQKIFPFTDSWKHL
jgi:hypothetical protein